MKSFKVKVLAWLVSVLFRMLALVVKIRAVNYPQTGQFILALWHGHQCVLFNVRPLENLNVLISQSNDGQIIATAVEALGMKTVRGSHGRRGTEATLKLIEKLEQGQNIAITVDGPKGPNRVAKKGIVNIAKLAQVPIVPVVWHSHSKCYFTFNSWDKMCFPLGPIDSVALYGEPIYVAQDSDDEAIEVYRKKIEDELTRLEKDLVENYDDYSNIAS